MESNGTTELQTIGAAVERYGATHEALWAALGSDWLEGKQFCRFEECSTGRRLTVEERTPYSLQVHYSNAGTEEASWSVELTHEDADGWGGYEVCAVASPTGHSARVLDGCLLAFRRLVDQGGASVLRTNALHVMALNPRAPEPKRRRRAKPNSEACTVAEVAERLGVGASTVYDAIAQGHIPSFRVGIRIGVPKWAVDKLLEAGRAWVGAERA